MARKRSAGQHAPSKKRPKQTSAKDAGGDTKRAAASSPAAGKPARAKKARNPGAETDRLAGKAASAGTPRRRVSEKRQRANEALRLEMHALRGALARIVEGYEVRVGGRINDMLRTLEGDDSLDQAPRFLTNAQAQAALDEIAAVQLRPDKPKLRDLRRIQRLIRKLRARIPE